MQETHISCIAIRCQSPYNFPMANNSGFVDIFRYFTLFWSYLLLPATRREINAELRATQGSARGYMIFNAMLAIFFGAIVPAALLVAVLQ